MEYWNLLSEFFEFILLRMEGDSNMIFNEQNLNNGSLLREIEEEENQREKSTHTTQAQNKRKDEEHRESRSLRWKDYDKVWFEFGDPPIKKLKGKCKRCGTLIAADPRSGTNGFKKPYCCMFEEVIQIATQSRSNCSELLHGSKWWYCIFDKLEV